MTCGWAGGACEIVAVDGEVNHSDIMARLSPEGSEDGQSMFDDFLLLMKGGHDDAWEGDRDDAGAALEHSQNVGDEDMERGDAGTVIEHRDGTQMDGTSRLLDASGFADAMVLGETSKDAEIAALKAEIAALKAEKRRLTLESWEPLKQSLPHAKQPSVGASAPWARARNPEEMTYADGAGGACEIVAVDGEVNLSDIMARLSEDGQSMFDDLLPCSAQCGNDDAGAHMKGGQGAPLPSDEEVTMEDHDQAGSPYVVTHAGSHFSAGGRRRQQGAQGGHDVDLPRHLPQIKPAPRLRLEELGQDLHALVDNKLSHQDLMKIDLQLFFQTFSKRRFTYDNCSIPTEDMWLRIWNQCIESERKQKVHWPVPEHGPAAAQTSDAFHDGWCRRDRVEPCVRDAWDTYACENGCACVPVHAAVHCAVCARARGRACA